MLRLLDLPIELIDKLFEFVDEPADLLSLSLTCKAIHDLVVPDHLHWRHLCLSTSYRSAFETLGINRRIARHVRKLIIAEGKTTSLGLRGYRLASNPPSEAGRRDIATINAASRHLSQVERLELRAQAIHEYKDLFVNLGKKSLFLSDVSVLEPSITTQCPVLPVVEVIEAMSGGYKQFHWNTWTPQPSRPILEAITELLDKRCPDLEDALLSFGPMPLGPNPIWSCRWSNLRSIELQSVRGSAEMSAFLIAHSLLESISIECFDVPLLELPPSALPNARKIDIVWMDAPHLYIQAVNLLPSGCHRPLRQLSITSGAFEDASCLQVFCRMLERVLTLEELRWEDVSLQLSNRLAVIAESCRTVHTVGILLFYADRRLPEIGAALTRFANLRQLKIRRGRVDLDIVTRFGIICPNLQRINSWERRADTTWYFSGAMEHT